MSQSIGYCCGQLGLSPAQTPEGTAQNMPWNCPTVEQGSCVFANSIPHWLRNASGVGKSPALPGCPEHS